MYHSYLQFFTLELYLRCLQFFCYRGRCSSQLGVRFLPARIGDLRKLKTLIVDNNIFAQNDYEFEHNAIEKLPQEIGNLENLESLSLSGIGLKELPPEIGSLANLKELFLDDSHLSYRTINGELKLRKGSSNRLEKLPPEIKNLRNLQKLDLRGNLLPIPPEILKNINDPQAILNYYFSVVEQKKRSINEIKLLIVGEGSVGKTSIIQRILHNTFDQNQTKTEGISINQWQISGNEIRYSKGKKRISNNDSQISPIRLNVWDFGGQEIMHTTHQFFLTKRSLYLLVIDTRNTQEQNQVEYWLKIIQSFGDESPVLIVGNKVDMHPLDIDQTSLRNKYSNIVDIIETSAATGQGVGKLKESIIYNAVWDRNVLDRIPNAWFSVKTRIESLGLTKNYVTYDEYRNLCEKHEITDEQSQETLIYLLHELGTVLYFQNEPRLADLGILNPQWVTNGVYKILNSHELFQNQGTLTLPILNKILNLPEYPSNKRLFIVDMMKKFELCYDIEPDKSFLIPDLLPKDEIYTGEWNDVLAFQYHYNVLPSSIISRFIVRMNAFIHKNTIWRSGVVLKRGDNTALVKADTEDRKIYIWVGGKEDTRRDLLAMIRGEFDAIHKTIAKIEATEKVPLPNAPETAPVDLIFLQQMASEGRESLPVQVGNRIIDFVVKEVLSQIEKEGKTSPANMVVNIQGNVYGSIGNNNTVNFIQQKFEPIYEAIEASSRDASEKQDLVAEVDEIKNEVAKGDEVNESFLSRRLRNLKKMAPDIADVALVALANPTAAVGMVVQKIAKKIKEETK